MKSRTLKIYGERNTGTNYLHHLIEENLHVDLLRGVVPDVVMFLQRVLPGRELVRNVYFRWTFGENLGWKHALVNPERLSQCARSRDIGFVTITKNPYAWLLSLYERPYHQNPIEQQSFESFVRH